MYVLPVNKHHFDALPGKFCPGVSSNIKETKQLLTKFGIEVYIFKLNENQMNVPT